jgi:hypothetical protein
VRTATVIAALFISAIGVPAGGESQEILQIDSMKDAVHKVRTDSYESIVSNQDNLGEFYVRLRAEGRAAIPDPKKCVNRNWITKARQLFSSEASSVALFAKIVGPDSQTLIERLPLLSINIDESSSENCRSYVVHDRDISPLYKAEGAFNLEFSIEYSKESDIGFSEAAGGAMSLLASAYTGNSFVVATETRSAVTAATKSIDDALSNAGPRTSINTIPTSLTPLGTPSHDALLFSLRGVKATSWGGVSITDDNQAFMLVSLQIRESIFRTNNGKYMRSSADYLRVPLPRHEHTTLSDLLTREDGIGPKKDALAGSSSSATAFATQCRILRGYLSNNVGLTNTDELFARAAILFNYSMYKQNASIRSDACLTVEEEERLVSLAGKNWSVDQQRLGIDRSLLLRGFGEKLARSFATPPNPIRLRRLENLIADTSKFVLALYEQNLTSNEENGYQDAIAQDALALFKQLPATSSVSCLQAPTGRFSKFGLVVQFSGTNKVAAVGVELAEPVRVKDDFDPASEEDIDEVVSEMKISEIHIGPLAEVGGGFSMPNGWPYTNTNANCQALVAATLAENAL